MKKIEKIYEGKILVAKTGKIGTQDFRQVAVSGLEQEDGAFVFKLIKTIGLIHMTIETKEVARVISEMRAFAPKQSDWRVSRKAKNPTDPSKIKSGKAETTQAEVAQATAIKKGRG